MENKIEYQVISNDKSLFEIIEYIENFNIKNNCILQVSLCDENTPDETKNIEIFDVLWAGIALIKVHDRLEHSFIIYASSCLDGLNSWIPCEYETVKMFNKDYVLNNINKFKEMVRNGNYKNADLIDCYPENDCYINCFEA